MTCKNKFDHDSILHIVPTGANRIPHIIYLRRVAIFTKACSWTSCPNKQQKTYCLRLRHDSSCVLATTSHHRILDADSAALPQMILRHVVMLCIFPPPALAHRLRKNTQPYGYRGLKIFTPLSYVSKIFSVGIVFA